MARFVGALCAVVVGFSGVPGAHAESAAPLTVFSAGSAKGVLTAIFARYTRETGEAVVEVGGSAGLMLDRIEAGEPADLFVSANMGYARRLSAQGKGTATVVFARNRLCAIAVPAVGLTRTNILDRLLDPAVRIGSSNPKNDPSGQYAFAVFDRAEALRPGAAAILKAKVRIAAGTPLPAPAPAPAEKSDAAQRMAERGVDAMVSFCSRSDAVPDSSVTQVELPDELTVPVAYGMTVLIGIGDAARRERANKLAAFLVGPEAQAILPAYGFQMAGAVAADQL